MKLASYFTRRFRPQKSLRELEGDLQGGVRDAAAFLRQLRNEDYVALSYQMILNRPADAVGYRDFVSQLDSGQMTREEFIGTLVGSAEFRALRFLDAVHGSRLEVIRQLPKAAHIVDLGGSSKDRPEGALVALGYPYAFQSLRIVELPRERRHAIYADHCGDYHDVVSTSLGPVRYVFTSMTDLASFQDNSIDLVYSGQSIEHITRDEARLVCREVRRILRPGGSFCLDTPNRAVTVLECPDSFINPDHKHEYTHAELSGMLADAGFRIAEAKGLCLAADSVRTRTFDRDACMRRPGLYDDIENCYLLYYRCVK